jgi:Trypsin
VRLRACRSHPPAHMQARRPLLVFLSLLSIALVLACSGELGGPGSTATGPVADESLPPAGVADRGDDPAVVALDIAGEVVCSGVLVAPDALLTARRCAAVTSMQGQCPDGGPRIVTTLAPQSLHVLVGDKVTGTEERARGRQIVVPDDDPSCGADVAIVLLDTPIDDIEPMTIRPTGAAKGDGLRTTDFVRLGGAPALDKLVRDHAMVLDVTPTEIAIGEACLTVPGGPAIDEATVEVVGVASRPGGSDCASAGALDMYTRTDTLLPFIGDALARLALPSRSSAGEDKTKKGAVDVGATCLRGVDCAAGVCVTDGLREYCSRMCGAHDRCPSLFSCKGASGGAWICAE